MKTPKSLFLTDDNLGAATDLYQLTMAAGYFQNNMNFPATFELFVRRLPEHRSYLISAGLEQAVHYLQHLKFSEAIINYLQKHPVFKDVGHTGPKDMGRDFFKYLRNFKFTGDVHAIPEGTLVFSNEPLLRVTAPIIETQLVETYLLSTINFQTLIASKAARVVHSARRKDVIDFGTRRAHGAQAGVLAARACFIGGCAGTSNVLAGYELGIPIVGTMAHSWVMACDTELESFQKYYSVFPDSTVLLIDTYDTLNAANLTTMVAKGIKGVRLDSGNLLELSVKVRRTLDEKGLTHVKILASGDLNEYIIDDLLKNGAPIDSFGVGTEMVTSKDAPALGGIYKLVELVKDENTIPKMKFSEDKATYPSKKQVYRRLDNDGFFTEDIVGLEGEGLTEKQLLVQAVRNGTLCYELPTINEIQKNTIENLSHLPGRYKRIKYPDSYTVAWSERLEQLKTDTEKGLRERAMG
ncbi:MAG: nicotinate phosphoribosyltransferase [Planctomycetes bacterium]|nr:nicotinate phosphoribosyltransferase [Planctomycetota bacterium]